MLALTLILVILVSGCRNPLPVSQMNCDEIAEPTLRSVDFDALNRERMLQWIEDNYQLETTRPIDPQLGTRLDWQRDGKIYQTDFQRGRLVRIMVLWRSQQPTGNQILECFGPPDSYSATHRPGASRWDFELDLVYFNEGLVVTLYRATGGPQPPAVDGHSTMTHLAVVRSGSAEAVLKDAYAAEGSTRFQLKVMALKPWPGTWEDIEVEVEPLP